MATYLRSCYFADSCDRLGFNRKLSVRSHFDNCCYFVGDHYSMALITGERIDLLARTVARRHLKAILRTVRHNVVQLFH